MYKATFRSPSSPTSTCPKCGEIVKVDGDCECKRIRMLLIS